MLRKKMASVLGEGVGLIGVGEAMAGQVRERLRAEGLVSDKTAGGSCRYYVSDEVDDFETFGSMFLESRIEGMVNKIDIDKF